jgi:hypothetical protein
MLGVLIVPGAVIIDRDQQARVYLSRGAGDPLMGVRWLGWRGYALAGRRAARCTAAHQIPEQVVPLTVVAASGPEVLR